MNILQKFMIDTSSFKPDKCDHLELVTTVTVKDPMENQVYGENMSPLKRGGDPWGCNETVLLKFELHNYDFALFLKKGLSEPHFSDSPSTDQ